MMGLLEAHAGLRGKTAVLVGGATGTGRNIALTLARAGVNIASCDIEVEASRTLTGEVEALSVKAFSTVADVCDAAALNRFYDEVAARFDRIDILVNLAGGTKRGFFTDSTPERDASDIRLNYGYILDSCRRAVALMRRGGGGGSIINFTTIEAHRGAAGFSVYAGAKAATTNFSKALAVELGAERIRVNLLAPDTTPSGGGPKAMEPEVMAAFADIRPEVAPEGYNMYIPQQEPPSQDDLADAVLFLASDLSQSITGIVLHVDGGTSASLGFLKWPHGDGFSPAPLPQTLKRLF